MQAWTRIAGMRRCFVFPVLGLSLALIMGAAPKDKDAVTSTADTRRALSHKVPEVNFANVALTDAVDALRDLSGANIHVSWRALEQINVTRETPVNVRL